MKKIIIWRWTFYFVGMLIMSLGISMTIKGHKIGIGPWDVLHVGLYRNFGLTIGMWNVILGFLIIIGTCVVIKQWPKIGTWINIFFIGAFIDVFNWLLPEIEPLAGQAVIFILGAVVISYGTGIYVSSNIGAGPRDSLMLVLVERLGGSIKKTRTIIEFIVAILGWILGGPIGVGTVIIAILLGQFIHYTLPQSIAVLMKITGESDEKFLL